MNEWKNYFIRKIYDTIGTEKAYLSYAEKIKNFQYDNAYYRATIDGYEVCIIRDQLTPKKMTCTCPYAQKGKKCKHMAQLMYYYEIQNGSALFDLVLSGKLSEDHIVAFQTDRGPKPYLAKESGAFAELLRSCKEEMDAAISSFIPDTNTFENNLHKIYQQLVFQFGTPDALQVSISSVANIFYLKDILNTFSTKSECTFLYSYRYLAMYCKQYIEKIITFDDFYKDFVFNEVYAHLFQCNKDFMHKELASLLFKHYCEEKYYDKLLTLSKENAELLDHLGEDTPDKDIAVKWVFAHLAIMNLRSCSLDEQKQYAYEFIHMKLVDRWFYNPKPIDVYKVVQLFEL